MISAINNATIYTGTRELTGQSLLFRNKRIEAIVPLSEVPSDANITDATGLLLTPGFIDLQIYGAGGYLFSNSPSAAALKAISDAIVRSGTTTYMLTLATNELSIYLQAFDVAKQNPHPALAGIHLEGPYFNPVKRGAHIEKLIHSPELQEVQSLITAANGIFRMMTLAPEMVSDEVLQLLLQNNVILSAGHSNATYDQAMAGFSKGIRTVTHLFNAMSTLHHRDTGLPGAAYLSQSTYASIIADGVHVDWQTLRISKQMMGRRLFLITDAVDENLEGAYIHLRKSDRFTLPDGTLSGSCITMLDAIRNCVQHAGIELPEALRMATLYPSEVMQAPDLGRLEPGARANLVLVDQELSSVKSVWLEGEKIA
ncbi:MAG: N-acetylglucosamine-6-phosphate deacetylase [Pseudobacter sp.]|uniref:N-acetylglucosamine-6-phosphate deacetylase n=1 Tax=Pseudobacter sp. TaxID=2045420 RepID=UPI003F8237AD